MEVKPEVWQEIADHWADVRQALEDNLDTKSMTRFDDNGLLVECERPMLESIVCDFQERSPRFFFYLLVAQGLPTIKQSAGGRRIIEIGTMTPLPLSTGGREENVRSK